VGKEKESEKGGARQMMKFQEDSLPWLLRERGGRRKLESEKGGAS